MVQVRATSFRGYLECQRKFKWRSEWTYGGPARPGVMELGSLTHHLIFLELSKRLTFTKPSSTSITPWLQTVEPHEPSVMANLNASIDPEALRNGAMAWIESKYLNDPDSQSISIQQHLPYALAMTRNLLAWFDFNAFFEEWEVVLIENTLEMNVGDNAISGTPDLVVQHRVTGSHGIVDYKTGGDLSRTLHAADWQMLVYALLLEAAGFKPYYAVHLKIKRIKFNKKAKPPYVDKQEMRFNEQKLTDGWVKVRGLLDRIQNDNLWLPNPTHLCLRTNSPCQFLDACEAADSNQDHEYVLRQTHVRIEDANSEEEAAPSAHAEGS